MCVLLLGWTVSKMFALVHVRTFKFGCCDFAHEVCGLSLLCVLLNFVKLLFLSLFLLLILFLLLLFFLVLTFYHQLFCHA